MTNLDSILKSRDITLPTKVCLVKAMVFPVVMYGYDSWTIKKAEHQKIDAFELQCWGRLLRVPWTARRSNQSILKEISPGCSLEGLMASSPITSWEIDGETVETVSGFIFLGSKTAADGDYSHEIKRRLLLGRKVMTNLDSIFKSRDITLPTKVCLVKTMVFPVVMYGCESWTVKKAKSWRIDAFELWCWRRLLRVPWTARRSNQSILKETRPVCSLEGLMLRLKLQYFGHLMQRVDSLEKTLMLGGVGGQEEKGTTENEMAGWHHRLDAHEFGWTLRVGDGQGGLACCDSWGRRESDTTKQLNWNEYSGWYIVGLQPKEWMNKWIGTVLISSLIFSSSLVSSYSSL